MMARRWKIALWISTFIFAFVFLARFIRFYHNWYGMPVTLRKLLSANLAYIKGDWLNLLIGALFLVGMATNWALEKKREQQIK